MTDAALRPAAAQAANPFLTGNFAPVAVETTAFDLPVEGKIPEELNGRLLRIGPNPIDPDPATYEWFVGEGMAHGLRLREGKPEWYRNRWIVCDDIAARRGRAPLPRPPDRSPQGSPNTNILAMGGRTYAVMESGRLLVELTNELESVAWSTLDGTLPHGFSAHPKADPITGELHVLTYEVGLAEVSYLVVNRQGLARTLANIPAPHCPLVHDTAFTERYVILLDLPVVYDPDLAGKGFRFSWTDTRAPRIGLIPRNGDLSGMRWIEAPPDCYVFHVMNAFDDGSDVVMDVVRHGRLFHRSEKVAPDGVLVRWRLDLQSGRTSQTTLFARDCEYPRFNDAKGGLRYRFGYTAGSPFSTGPLYKHDVFSGETSVHDFGPGRCALEPVFVARQGAVAEDDGFVMTYLYDQRRDASDVVILNALRFEDEPLAVIHLPVRVPYGFHGNWVPEPA